MFFSRRARKYNQESLPEYRTKKFKKRKKLKIIKEQFRRSKFVLLRTSKKNKQKE